MRRGGQQRYHRYVINGLLWKLRMGAPWRDLPRRYGALQTSPLISKRATLNTFGMHYSILGCTFSNASSTECRSHRWLRRVPGIFSQRC